MLSELTQPQVAVTVAPVPEWLRGLVRAVRSEAIQPKDVRVKSLWDLLRQRQLLRQSLWLMALLHRIWYRGLQARSRPRTTRRLKKRLRHWGILPPLAVRGAVAPHPAPMRPIAPVPVQLVRPVAVKPVGSVRPVSMQPVRPVQMQSASPTAVRK